MTKIIKVLVSLSLVFIAQSVVAQDSEVTISTKTHGDWQVRCEQIKGGKKTCVMTQQALVQNSGQRLMQVNVGQGDDGTQMTMILPLGISLPAGAALHLSETNSMPLVISFCTQAGCFVNQILSKKLSGDIAAQESVTVGVETNDGKALDIPISTNGFAEALKAI